MASNYQELQDTKWMEHFKKLLQFQEKTGALYPKPNDGDSSLYNWAKNQRRLFRNKKLKSRRLKLLKDQAQFPWKAQNLTFEDRVKQLVRFNKDHNTMHVSQVAYSKGSDMHKLSRWVNEMRRLYNENRLPLDRISKLNAVGFIWNMEDEQFSKNLTRLKRFHKAHGHFDVPQTGKTRKLGSWVAQIRSRGLVKKHHIKALNDIGFIWEGKYTRRRKARNIMREVDMKNFVKKRRSKKQLAEAG